MPLEFEDNRMAVKEALFDAGEAFVYEACGEIQAKTKRNSRVDTGVTKGSYDYHVSSSFMAGEIVGQVGSSLENSIWEEFGTGEYALHGDGRKGGWFYEDEKGVGHFTYGKTPNRPLNNAFVELKQKLLNRYAELLRSKLGG